MQHRFTEHELMDQRFQPHNVGLCKVISEALLAMIKKNLVSV